MGLPRFRPAALFVNSRDFGRNSYGQLAENPNLDPGQRAWALSQHQVSMAILKKLKKREWSIYDLADELGESRDWLTRKIYGRVPADLGEMYVWCAAVGIDLKLIC
jgi:hypothetical protein